MKRRIKMSAGYTVDKPLFGIAMPNIIVVSNYDGVNMVGHAAYYDRSSGGKGFSGYRTGQWNVKPKL